MTQHSPWRRSHRADPLGCAIADRHYNRQKIGSPQFVPPGRCIVLLANEGSALWVTSWPMAEYVKHEWAGAWVNSCFRNESPDIHLSSELITSAVAATLAEWPTPPDLGFITFVKRSAVKSKRNPGYCYIMAGWEHVGFTKGGLWAYQLTPDRFPDPLPVEGTPIPLFSPAEHGGVGTLEGDSPGK